MRYITLSACAALLMGMAACSSDDITLKSNDYGSTIESTDGRRVSTFVISNAGMDAPDSLKMVRVILTPEASDEPLSFDASIIVDRDNMKCMMVIPAGESIPDGKYVLIIKTQDDQTLGARLQVRFVDEMLHTVSAQSIMYMGLSGEGTKEDPYRIASSDDFAMMVSNLRRDSLELGRGRYFKQTSSFQAPTQSKLIDGRGYYSYSFAGNYDGGGNSITGLYYIGADNSDREPGKDSHIGLFSSLQDGAVIQNLEISNASIVNGYDYIGFLAGESSGNVSIENVQASGSIINANNYCGALIGMHSKGSISIKNHDIASNITGKDYIGGVIGKIDSSTATIENVSTSSRQFSIKGEQAVGGLIGYFSGSLHASRISITHTVSEEDSKVKIVSGTQNVGGMIGNASFSQKECSLDNISVKCPVGGENYTGGIFGLLNVSIPTSVSKCLYSSLVTGIQYTGGFAGEIYTADNLLKFIGKDNESRVVVTMADTGVNGKIGTGGFAGKLYGTISFDAKFEIAVNVSHGDNNYVGGAVGELTGGTLHADRISMTSNTMNVKGTYYVGGIVGYVKNANVVGTDKFDYSSKWIIPTLSSRHSLFCGNVTGDEYVGGLVGFIESDNLQALHSTATVTANTNGGGIVGYADGKGTNSYIIEDSSFAGTLKVSASNAGGIVGGREGGMLVKDCVNYADISCNDQTGGITGWVDYHKIATNTDYCVNLGKISGGKWVGGIVGGMDGHDYYTRVYKCGNYGSVTSNGEHAGGIVGTCQNKRIRVWNCANHGDIQSNCDGGAVGGIAAHLGEDPNGVHSAANLEVRECYNSGKVSTTKFHVHIGGILGYQEEGGSDSGDHDSWVHDCVNEGDIPSDTHDDTGGIVGCIDHYSVIERCYNRGKISDGNAMIGTRKSSAINTCHDLFALKDSGKGWKCNGFYEKGTPENKYYNYDFTNVWIMTDGYPRLRDCPFQNVHP